MKTGLFLSLALSCIPALKIHPHSPSLNIRCLRSSRQTHNDDDTTLKSVMTPCKWLRRVKCAFESGGRGEIQIPCRRRQSLCQQGILGGLRSMRFPQIGKCRYLCRILGFSHVRSCISRKTKNSKQEWLENPSALNFIPFPGFPMIFVG